MLCSRSLAGLMGRAGHWEREHANENELERGGRVTVNLLSVSRLKGRMALGVAAVAAILMTFGGATAAHAQLQDDRETYAVVDFNVGVPNSSVNLGESARDAVRSELAKALEGSVDILPQEQVNRALADLGFVPPVSRTADLVRLSQTLGLNFLVTGEVVNWQVSAVDGGKQAAVLMRVIVRDSSSGIPVNGSALQGLSGVRTGDVSEATLLSEAIADAAFHSVQTIKSTKNPSGTVLSFLNDQILVNRGARSGFKQGDKVLIQRGTRQVGEGLITNVDSTSAFARLTRGGSLGVQPGDTVVRIVEPPMIKGFDAKGNPRFEKRKSSNGNQGLITILILVVILGFLLGQGRGGSSDVIAGVTAEAIMQANDTAGVKVAWKRDAFMRGNNEGPFQWQVFRDGALVAVADGNQGSAIDDTLGTFAGTAFTPPVGNSLEDCWTPGTTGNTAGGTTGGTTGTTGTTTTTTTGGTGGGLNTTGGTTGGTTGTPTAAGTLVPGTPYQYSVRVLYRVSALSLPNTGGTGGGGTTGGGLNGGGGTTGGGLSGGGGTTGGNTTGGNTGGTTGGTTGGGTTSGGDGYCYALSSAVNASGIATPLLRPSLIGPLDNTLIQSPITFQFTSARGAVASVPLEYVVQLSTSSAFPANETTTLSPFQDFNTAAGQTLVSPTVDTSVYYPNATQIFWRIGVRNSQDSPGPVADSSGRRYIFSRPAFFRRN